MLYSNGCINTLTSCPVAMSIAVYTVPDALKKHIREAGKNFIKLHAMDSHTLCRYKTKFSTKK